MMNNDYLYIPLNSKNEFRTVASFEINGNIYSNVDVKIDTGCPRTSFPIQKLGLSDAEAYRLKAIDCQDPNTIKNISFGVNDTLLKRKDDKKKFRAKRYMEITSITFRHTAQNFKLGGVALGDYSVLVSYDRTGNVLIGMDIIKTMDAHIGKTKQGDIVLIACAEGSYFTAYNEALLKLYHLQKIS